MLHKSNEEKESLVTSYQVLLLTCRSKLNSKTPLKTIQIDKKNTVNIKNLVIRIKNTCLESNIRYF